MTKTVREILIVGIVTVAAVSFIAGAYTITKLPEEEFVKRMAIPQMDFSDMTTFDEAIAMVERQDRIFLSQDILFTSERGDVNISAVGLGASSPVDETVATLSNFMTNASALEKIQVYLFGKTLDFSLNVNQELMKLVVAETGVEQGVKNAEFFYDKTVQVAPEQIGYGIDTEALTLQLQDYWSNFEVPAQATLPLRTSEPEIRTAQLEALLPQAEAIAARTFSLTDEFGSIWEFSMADHVGILIPATTTATTETGLTIDEAKFITAVELELVPEIEEAPQPAIINEKEDGTYDFVGSARFGREIDKTALLASIKTALTTTADPATNPDTITLPILQIEPEVTIPQSLKDKGITGLIGYGYSTFKTSPSNRITNVNHGFNLFNGTLVEKDTEFSFTSLMGPVDAAHGWLPELVIKGDETIPEYGGGMCQVSSTMFRAALYTGLPITARTNHSYAVSYYAYPFGYGLDATVYDPNPDLRFMNDTPGAILIQGYTEGDNAYFVFYGTNDHRTVKMEGPVYYDYQSTAEVKTEYTTELAPGVRELEEYAHTGFKVDWYRTVLYPVDSPSTYAAAASGVRENIHSNYETRPAKYLEGTPEGGVPVVTE